MNTCIPEGTSLVKYVRNTNQIMSVVTEPGRRGQVGPVPRPIPVKVDQEKVAFQISRFLPSAEFLDPLLDRQPNKKKCC